ncbi:MAG TPA: polysaccharide deacetylase family protein, partial [Gemmatimonadales bacterium]|nr:polysaccharide deacetylase family protein [Gemmatimonadales bacterium]
GDARASASGFAGADAEVYKLPLPLFGAHLDAIGATAKAIFSGPANVLAGALARPATAVLSFDDGGASAWPVTAELLERHGWRGLFFITTDRIGTPGFLDEDAIRALAGSGHIVGSHSVSHPARMATLDPPSLQREWRDSRERLESLLGAPVRIASVPGGYHSAAVARAAAECGYEVLFTSEPRRVPWRSGSLLVAGRFSVMRATPPAVAAALGTGDRVACTRQSAGWAAKKVLKRVGGPAWLAFRRRYWEWKAKGR